MQHHHQHAHMHNLVRDTGFVGSSSSASRVVVDKASRVLVARATSTCTNGDAPGCTKMTETPTLAIALGIIIPIFGLAVTLTYLHFRNKKKLLAEDAKDKYKSLDFGMEPGLGGRRKGQKAPEMSVLEKETRGQHDRGLSLETGSPYILPVGLHGSRESFHSLSRSQIDPHDPYRPVTFMKDDARARSQSRIHGDQGSMYTMSSAGTHQSRMGDGLLKNASSMPRSVPARGDSLSPENPQAPDAQFPDPASALSPLNPRFIGEQLPLSTVTPAAESTTPTASLKPAEVPTITIPEPAILNREVTRSPVETNESAFPPRVQSQHAVVHHKANTNSLLSTSSYGDGFQVTPPSPRLSQTKEDILSPEPLQLQEARSTGLGVEDLGRNTNRLSMSLRPLPSDDPEENPEQRANRIRSFYKEYFDDSKPEPVGTHAYTDYYEDYGSEYQDGTLFDSRNGNFIVAQPNAPFAEPITRRAMTPPPRAPPRFRSNTATGPSPHMSSSSMASSQQHPPRGMSSMSGRLPPAAKRPLPPPSALSSLPTPSKLTENAMVFDPIDFAPPVTFRERQNGLRPDSPLGTPRPFSPAVRPHTPLVGSYDELPVLPSPHLMRKSGTFTALDFAPPGRIRDPASGGASDAGSIRSNRSGISAVGRFAVRSGANRVSRIPRDVVGTRDDFMVQLRPQMNLVTRA